MKAFFQIWFRKRIGKAFSEIRLLDIFKILAFEAASRNGLESSRFEKQSFQEI